MVRRVLGVRSWSSSLVCPGEEDSSKRRAGFNEDRASLYSTGQDNVTHREVTMLRDEAEKVTRSRQSMMSYSTETEGVALSTKQSWAGDTWGSSGAPITAGLLCTSCEVGVPPA